MSCMSCSTVYEIQDNYLKHIKHKFLKKQNSMFQTQAFGILPILFQIVKDPVM